MKCVCLLLCLVGFQVTLAQVPKPCTSPVAFQASASVYNYEDNKIDRFKMTYDEVNHRKVYFEEDIEVFPGRKFYEYLILNNLNIMYTIDLKTRECTRSIPRPWRDYGILNNSTFEAEFTIGGPLDSVLVQQWTRKLSLTQLSSLHVFSVHDCYPVQITMFESDTFTSATNLDFYNVLEGIPDPNAFIPPTECQNATLVEPDARYKRLIL